MPAEAAPAAITKPAASTAFTAPAPASATPSVGVRPSHQLLSLERSEIMRSAKLAGSATPAGAVRLSPYLFLLKLQGICAVSRSFLQEAKVVNLACHHTDS